MTWISDNTKLRRKHPDSVEENPKISYGLIKTLRDIGFLLDKGLHAALNQNWQNIFQGFIAHLVFEIYICKLIIMLVRLCKMANKFLKCNRRVTFRCRRYILMLYRSNQNENVVISSKMYIPTIKKTDWSGQFKDADMSHMKSQMN